MREPLIPQQFELSYHEAYCLCREISRWLYRPIGSGSMRLQPFEVLASLHLKAAGKRLARRLESRKPKATRFKFTLSAYELIAIHQVINTYPVSLYNFLSEVDRKILNYDTLVEFNCSS